MQIDHTTYPESLKNKTTTELHFIIQDAQEAIRANPTGPKSGYYADEVNYCVNELYKRRKAL